MPSELQSPCCSTFLVSRERITKHQKEFYIHLRDWIIRCYTTLYREQLIIQDFANTSLGFMVLWQASQYNQLHYQLWSMKISWMSSDWTQKMKEVNSLLLITASESNLTRSWCHEKMWLGSKILHKAEAILPASAWFTFAIFLLRIIYERLITIVTQCRDALAGQKWTHTEQEGCWNTRGIWYLERSQSWKHCQNALC